MSLAGKHILLGVTGGIAAYKIPLLVRLLVKEGAEVRVMMTPAARDFVTPLTLSVVSKHPVAVDFIRNDHTWQNHVEWARWADAVLIAPLTANTLAKLVQGQADTFLTATVMSAECPVLLAPAMDAEMYAYPGVQKNLDTLAGYGMEVIPAETGELASGLTGQGRMPEPQTLLEHLRRLFEPAEGPWKNKRVLITAGPTHEPLDPVRFIGNRSSGKTGFALADAFHKAGADVRLILGPVCEGYQRLPYKVVRVQTAREMFDAVMGRKDETDIFVMAAAVADFRPAQTATNKIKKTGSRLHIELEPNPDILASLGHSKSEGQILVGFALETENEKQNALEKLQRKNADMIVLNSLRDAGAGFGTDTNKITVLHRDGTSREYPLKSKKALAYDLLREMEKYF